MNVLKKFTISTIADALSICTFLFDIVKDWWDTYLPNSMDPIFNCLRWILVIVFSLLMFYYLIILIIRRKLIKAGTHDIECNLTNYYYYKITNNHKAILTKIHKDIYHETYKIKKKISEEKFESKNQIKDSVNNLLNNFQKTLHSLFKLDVSIGIKFVAVKKGEDNKNDIILQTFIFRPSSKEQEMENRNVKKDFLLSEQSSDDIKDFVKKAKQYKDTNGIGKYFNNSAFDYVLSTTNNYWMSNNLIIDNKNGKFFTSSDNFNKYYKSLAVFAIIPPAPEGEKELPIRGVLTFDSKETGLFSEMECKMMMGYMAHCLYEIFENLK